MLFNKSLPEFSPLRLAIVDAYRMDETTCVEKLIQEASLPADMLARISDKARELVVAVRQARIGKGGLDAFLHQYDLSSDEGLALMCLAEAMLRIPDSATADRLIRDKIASADWVAHLGQSRSFAINAATWGLLLTGKIMAPEEASTGGLGSALKRFVGRSTAPVIRQAVRQAMKVLGEQFVMGTTIEEALSRARTYEKQGYLYSYDMLGEAARTAADADRYFHDYERAIAAVGKGSQGKGIIQGPGISVKLSALYPRYEFAQRSAALTHLIPRLRTLVLQAKASNIGVVVDAEEADRLDISLDIIEAVFNDPALRGWEGFGLAVQSYQKRGFPLIDWVIDLARRGQRRLLVRLIKGAYWDTEIKISQMLGLEGYPVFTRKIATDVSFLACAKKILAAPDAIYPSFATHNAYTVAAVLAMAQGRQDYEFQCLHGMGYTLYDQLLANTHINVACRVYAPVGGHEDLLAYLVRRLLENGANTSFVNRIIDQHVPVEELIADPVAKLRDLAYKPHPHIPLPRDLYGSERRNSSGLDFTNIHTLKQLKVEMEEAQDIVFAVPTVAEQPDFTEAQPISAPRDKREVVGNVVNATPAEVELSLQRATLAAASWNATPVTARADYLDRIAELFEQHRAELMMLAVREAGKTIPDALAEVREAIDFCYYYAAQARMHLVPRELTGPTGEYNELSMHGRGVISCISPWNFPLAIFTGQVVAALVAGNTVIAKPAAQTPLIAAFAVRLMHEAGIPKDVVQLLPGRGTVVGARLVEDLRVKGIIFTGSTETARTINQTLAARPGPIIPFIAETGGQNAMIVDSSALPEQVVFDVITSAFGSAGQRCSALRVLFVQEDIAPKLIEMLKGAMAELHIGDPSMLTTDIGPVIDVNARAGLEEHAERMQKEATLIYQVNLPHSTEHGCYFAPRAFEIEHLKQLSREVFGPILHVIRYKSDQLDSVLQQISDTGYGLTQGIHSRIDETVHYIHQRLSVGNTYVNRNMIGAVVGVQPFGGEGLSGTGPKAGGPHYLQRLCTERTLTINTTAAGGNATLMSMGEG